MGSTCVENMSERGVIDCPDCRAGIVDSSGFGTPHTCERCKGIGSIHVADFTLDHVHSLEGKLWTWVIANNKGDCAEVHEIVQQPDGTYEVMFAYDDHNGREAICRLHFSCHLTYNGKVEDFEPL